MKRDKLDEILGAEEEIVPSSGFADSVMQRIHEEAIALPPIPFPWKRALPGFIVVVCASGWGAVELVRESISSISAASQLPATIPIATLHPLEGAGWVALALSAALVSWLLARRLAGNSGLL
ncbi:MAG TPA: hypothetical protein VMU48_10050 [Terracidiphilus sp.]|nr:hypothetical protein [Terracidiphilus sp.]